MLPPLFAALALCAPPKPLEGAVIVVDAGHGGQSYSKSYTGGTRGVNSRLTESDLNLRVARELARILTERGATVFETRTSDRRLSREGGPRADELRCRVELVESRDPHFFLSVHHNAGGEKASGHTCLYKHNAADDSLYEGLATAVNEALAAAVPGPKLKLIKGDYHVLRETGIPGTISEAGFLTNAGFDAKANEADFPRREAEAIADGAARYWATHRPALEALRDKLAKERAAKPRDPDGMAAVDLNPKFQRELKERVARLTGGEKPDAAKVPAYLEKFRAEAGDGFAVTATVDGGKVALGGSVGRREDHDRLVDALVGMGLSPAANGVKLPAK